MTVKYYVLYEEIRHELQSLAKVITRIEAGLADFDKSDAGNKQYIADSLALSLLSFYTGIENVFRN